MSPPSLLLPPSCRALPNQKILVGVSLRVPAVPESRSVPSRCPLPENCRDSAVSLSLRFFFFCFLSQSLSLSLSLSGSSSSCLARNKQINQKKLGISGGPSAPSTLVLISRSPISNPTCLAMANLPPPVLRLQTGPAQCGCSSPLAK